MPYAATLRFGDGGFAIVHSSKPIKACGVCGAKISAFLCDYPMGSGTCDLNLCDDCRSHEEPDRDYCPDHSRDLPW